MCILLFHYHPSATTRLDSCQCPCQYRLIAANNRDEFFERPTATLAFWEDDPNILAGRDVQKSDPAERGTWLGISRKGRFAVVTNFRSHIHEIKLDAKTRGQLVTNFLSGQSSSWEYSQSVLKEKNSYNGFSLLTADLNEGGEAVYCSNRDESDGPRVLSPGNYGLSNSLLDKPWAKVTRGKERFSQVLREVTDKTQLTDLLLDVMADDTCLHPDPNIPDTGFAEDVLKFTSSVFVRPVTLYGHQYGTRTSSVVLVDRRGEVTYTERTLTLPLLPGSKPEWTTRQQTFFTDSSHL